VHAVELVVHVEVGGGLVEEEDVGLLDEGLGEEDALLLAAGERAERAVGEAAEVHGVECGADTVPVFVREPFEPSVVRCAAEEDELLDREVELERRTLADEREPPGEVARLPVADGPVVECERAGVGEEPGERPHQRRLAAPVRADQPDPAAGLDLEREAVQDRRPAEGDGERVGAEEGRGHGVGEHGGAARELVEPATTARAAMIRLRPLAVLALLLTLPACDTNVQQDEFLLDSELPPNGITRTNEAGEVLENDPDDWRVAPVFRGAVEVEPAYPNPVVRTGLVTLIVQDTFD